MNYFQHRRVAPRVLFLLLALGSSLAMGSNSLAAAPPGRFVLGVGDDTGTTKDLVNGLMWQRLANPQGEAVFTFADAQEYCAHLSLAGFADWRTPTIKELITMVDESNTPTVDPTYMPAGTYMCGMSDCYTELWSSTLYAGLLAGPSSAGRTGWALSLRDGVIRADPFNYSNAVRCVR